MMKKSPNSSLSTRRFSKIVLLINTILTWGAVYLAIQFGHSNVATTGLGLIGLLYSFYIGVGHLDMRKTIEMIQNGEANNETSEQ